MSGINLITKKTTHEIKEEKNIESSSIYAMFLPILALFALIGLLIANASVLENVKVEEQNIANQKAQITSLTPYKKNNGQLVKKLEALKPIIQKDVNPSLIFDQISKNISTYKDILSIDGYSRTTDGKFSFSGKSRTYLELSRVIKKFEENTDLKNVDLKSISYNEAEGNVGFTVNFSYVTL